MLFFSCRPNGSLPEASQRCAIEMNVSSMASPATADMTAITKTIRPACNSAGGCICDADEHGLRCGRLVHRRGKSDGRLRRLIHVHMRHDVRRA